MPFNLEGLLGGSISVNSYFFIMSILETGPYSFSTTTFENPQSSDSYEITIVLGWDSKKLPSTQLKTKVIQCYSQVIKIADLNKF